jgi:tripartite-type tricarboxylate transporter receptor subunit TctC
MKITRLWLAALLPALFAAFAPATAPVAAQDYPARPVKLVVPYPPGGASDALARILAAKLPETLGGQVYVENVAGAGGTIAAGQVARAAPDGYTLMIATIDVVVQPILKSKVPYDALKSFTPVTLLVTSPELIVVHPSVPAKTMKELIELLKANPGKYSYASPGYGTTPHLACEWLFKLEYGIDITHVPFQGTAPAVQSLIAGQTSIIHDIVPAVAAHVGQGTMRALAVASPKRSPALPDVPTLAEAGIAGHDIEFWIAVLAPAGTPRPIVDTLNRQVARILDMPDVKERLQKIGFDPASSTPDAAAAHMKAETDRWTKVVQDAKIKID